MSLGNRGGGRPPKPTALHLLDGTYRKDRHSKRHEAGFAKILPPAPKFLDATAKARYRKVGAMLLRLGVVTEGDMGILAMYAQSWSNWIAASAEAEADLARQREIEAAWDSGEHDEDWQTLEKRLRRVERRAVASSALQRVREEKLLLDRFGGQLGLSPTMRAKLRVEPAPKNVDPMEALLSGNGD